MTKAQRDAAERKATEDRLFRRGQDYWRGERGQQGAGAFADQTQQIVEQMTQGEDISFWDAMSAFMGGYRSAQ